MITLEQTLVRCLRFHRNKELERLRLEIEIITGGPNWNYAEYPEWLIIEAENNLKIRPAQSKIALDLIANEANQNQIVQLGMGEGKTSVIIPLIIARLSQNEKVVQLSVLRPLLEGTRTIMQQKLGGLLDRKIFIVPFERDVQLDRRGVLAYEKLLDRCKTEKCVLLTTPEYRVSFHLKYYEKLLSRSITDRNLRDSMHSLILKRQSALIQDIIDEADEAFSVKYQMIYSLGDQQEVSEEKNRVRVIQDVLGVVNRLADDFAKEKN